MTPRAASLPLPGPRAPPRPACSPYFPGAFDSAWWTPTTSPRVTPVTRRRPSCGVPCGRAGRPAAVPAVHRELRVARARGCGAYDPETRECLERENYQLDLDCQHLDAYDPVLYKKLVAYPQEIIPLFDVVANEHFVERVLPPARRRSREFRCARSTFARPTPCGTSTRRTSTRWWLCAGW